MRAAKTMTAAEWRKRVKADATPAPKRKMTAAEFRVAQGAEETLLERPAKPAEIRELRLRMTVVSEANQHEHWSRVSKRRLRQKSQVRTAWLDAELPIGSKPLRVQFTRRGPQTLDDDNMAGSCKHARDQIAKLCATDDGPDGPEWTYEQKKASENQLWVLVEWP